MDSGAVIQFLGKDWNAVSELMKSALTTDVRLLSEVNDGILCNEGKMLRPLLCLLSAKACSGTVPGDCCRYAAAVEMIHNATLMHDDVADDSSQRRGRPSVMSEIGASQAVLVGDFWLARAVNLVLGTSRYPEALRLFSTALNDLAEGEMLQLEKSRGADTTEQDYLRIIHCKTASLFVTAALLGVLSANAPTPLSDAMRNYAECCGTAFQIKDDILDYVGDNNLGKPVGSDIREKKMTMPLLGAIRNSGESERIRNMFRHNDVVDVDAVRRFVLDNGGVEYATKRLDEFILSAEESLKPLPPSEARDILMEVSRYNAMRRI